jgi:hypothetical protein
MNSLLMGAGTRNALGGADIRRVRRKLPKAIRAALERTFQYWLKKYAPTHFSRKAFAKYPEYRKSYKLPFKRGQRYSRSKSASPRDHALAILRWKIQAGKDTPSPLRASGALRAAFLHGSYKFTGGNEILNVTWPGLPVYSYKYRPGQIRKYVALTQASQDEYNAMIVVFEKFLAEEMAKIDPPSRSYGRVVL